MTNLEEKVRQRVKRLRSFYSAVIYYVIVNLILLVINLIFDPQDLWFYWVAIVWGIILIIQGLNTFSIRDTFVGEKWEQRKTEELLEKEKKKKRHE